MGTGRSLGNATLQGKSLSVEIVSDWLSAHKALCDRDTLLRDISPG